MACKIWAVIPAGGTGSRMNAAISKQYLSLNGRTVVEHTLDRLFACTAIDQAVIGIAKNDLHWGQLGYTHQKLTTVVEAGNERVDTVENCLQNIVEQGGEKDWALVHDAARPCVRVVDIERLIESVTAKAMPGVNNRAGGGILALPVSDTLKRGGHGSAAGLILDTLPRDALWRAMTPQFFKAGELLAAIRQSRLEGVNITDEASAMEPLGVQIRLVPCSPDNIKITLPHDIKLAEMILRTQQLETGPSL